MPKLMFITGFVLVVGCFDDPGPFVSDGDSGDSSDSSDDGSTDVTTYSEDTETSSWTSSDSSVSTEGDDDNTSSVTETEDNSSGDVTLPEPDLWYRLDGDLTDEVGDADGVAVGSLIYESGYDGLAGVFGDAGVYVDMSAFASLYREARDGVTVVLRIKPSEYPHLVNLVGLGDSGDDTQTNSHNLVVHNGAMQLFTEFDTVGSDSWAVLGPAPTLNEWHGIAVVIDHGEVQMFMDGIPEEPVEYKVSLTESDTMWMAAFGGNNVFHGMIDDIRIYLHPLSDDEAMALSLL
jgi:hypothetical protein